jgi:hypothetical protein
LEPSSLSYGSIGPMATALVYHLRMMASDSGNVCAWLSLVVHQLVSTPMLVVTNRLFLTNHIPLFNLSLIFSDFKNVEMSGDKKSKNSSFLEVQGSNWENKS